MNIFSWCNRNKQQCASATAFRSINNNQKSSINHTSNKIVVAPDKRMALFALVKRINHSNIVIDDSAIILVSIKKLNTQKISISVLRFFCVHHQISGYNSKSKEVTCILIVQWTRMQAIFNATYPWPIEEINSDDEDNTNKKGTCIANLSLCISVGVI